MAKSNGLLCHPKEFGLYPIPERANNHLFKLGMGKRYLVSRIEPEHFK